MECWNYFDAAPIYFYVFISFRLSLDCIGKNAVLLENQISWLPSKLLEQVVDKITFWAAVNYRQGKNAEVEGQEQISVS